MPRREWAGSPAGPRRPAEAEAAFARAERLGSINATAPELGTAWPSVRKAFQRHGLGMPARNPQAVPWRAAEAVQKHRGRPATPALDLVFMALNRDELPVRRARPTSGGVMIPPTMVVSRRRLYRGCGLWAVRSSHPIWSASDDGGTPSGGLQVERVQRWEGLRLD